MKLKDLNLGQLVKINTSNQKKDTYGIVLGVRNDSIDNIIDLEGKNHISVFICILCKFALFINDKEIQSKFSDLLLMTAQKSFSESITESKVVTITVDKISYIQDCFSEQQITQWVLKSKMLDSKLAKLLNENCVLPQELNAKIQCIKEDNKKDQVECKMFLQEMHKTFQSARHFFDNVATKAIEGHVYLWFDYDDWQRAFYVLYLGNNKYTVLGLYPAQADILILKKPLDSYILNTRTITQPTLYECSIDILQVKYNREKVEKVIQHL